MKATYTFSERASLARAPLDTTEILTGSGELDLTGGLGATEVLDLTGRLGVDRSFRSVPVVQSISGL